MHCSLIVAPDSTLILNTHFFCYALIFAEGALGSWSWCTFKINPCLPKMLAMSKCSFVPIWVIHWRYACMYCWQNLICQIRSGLINGNYKQSHAVWCSEEWDNCPEKVACFSQSHQEKPIPTLATDQEAAKYIYLPYGCLCSLCLNTEKNHYSQQQPSTTSQSHLREQWSLCLLNKYMLIFLI